MKNLILRALLILLFLSGFLGYILSFSIDVVSKLLEFFMWFAMINYSSPYISFFGGTIVRILTFLLSFELVGISFNYLGLFDKSGMKVLYYILSTIISFVLTWCIWCIEKYIYFIFIGLIALFITINVFILIYYSRRNKKCQNQ